MGCLRWPRPVRRRVLGVLVSLAVALAAAWCIAGSRAAAAPGPLVRVGLVTRGSSVSLGSPGRWLLLDSSGSPLTCSEGEVSLAPGPGDSVAVPGLGWVPGPLTVRAAPDDPSASGYVIVGGHPYRGEFTVFARDGSLTVVNVLPLEDYLLGVVPREMPSSFPIEALKAQAVAARTYALYVVASGAYAALGYDLVPTTACQVYGGVEAESGPATEAVRATEGEVVTYDGQLIGAYFHSGSGGHTESAEYVWGSAVPYLKGVPDFDQDSPHYNWTVTYTAEELSATLRDAGYDVGLLASVEGIGEPGPGGRYLERRLVGSRGEARLRSEKLRFALGLRSSSFEVVGEKARVAPVTAKLEPGEVTVVGAGGVTARASLETLAVVGAGLACRPGAGEAWAVSAIAIPATFTFSGHGWGHGLGLSQWGARALALEGKTYRDILTYYYTGVTVGTLP